MIRVFIGHDQVENVAFNVMANSIQRHASKPVAIAQVRLGQMSNFYHRERHPLQSNEFSFSRWLVPWMCGGEGWAIWADCDMLFMDDIAKLWDLRDDRYAVQVVKHQHKPVEKTKYLGTKQLPYERKNWSSLMLFNCNRCLKLTPAFVEVASGLDLHQFKWTRDDLIGDLPLRWNYLVGSNTQDQLGGETVANAHFTTGGPYFAEYQDVEFAAEWRAERNNMTHCEGAALAPD